ncbi:MAG: hypothetical protein ACK4VI_08070 [Alphaproteobacteria bacterium]
MVYARYSAATRKFFALAFGLWVLAVFAALSSGTLRAEEATQIDDTETHLRTLLETYIDDKKYEFYESGIDVHYEGEILIESFDGYFSVTLPYVTMEMQNGTKLDVGQIALNIAPFGTDSGQWKMTFALPTPIGFTPYNIDKDDAATKINLTIGGQRSSGVWNEALNYFSKLDANFHGLRLNSIDDSFSLSIPSSRIVYDLESDTSGKWSGPVYFNISDIHYKPDADAPEKDLTIGAFDLNLEMFQYDPAATPAYQQELMALLNIAEAPGVLKPNFAKFYEAFVAMIGNGFTSEYQLSDAQIGQTDLFETLTALRLDNLHFGFDLTGFLEDKVSLGIRVGFDGLMPTPPLSISPAQAPKNMNIDLVLENIPVREIMQTAFDHFAAETHDAEYDESDIRETADISEDAKAAAFEMLQSIPDILRRSATTLNVNNNYVGNDFYTLELSGALMTAPDQSLLPVTGAMNGKIFGLDALLEQVTIEMQAAMAEQSEKVSNLQALAMSLTLLRGFAKTETDETGEILHTFSFDIGTEGQLTVNGNDLSALLALLNLAQPVAASGSSGGAITQGTPAAPNTKSAPVPDVKIESDRETGVTE